MNIEEAKKNVGKEVLLLKETKPYFGRAMYSDNLTKSIEEEDHLILNEVSRNGDWVGVSGYVINPKHIALKEITISEIHDLSSNKEQEVKYKIGDEVVLRPETRPYSLKNTKGVAIPKQAELNDSLMYKVEKVLHDGDVYISGDGITRNCISHHHLKHAKENTNIGSLSVDLELNDLLKDIDLVELRLAIFNGDTSRTLEEMKAIEEWLLGEME